MYLWYYRFWSIIFSSHQSNPKPYGSYISQLQRHNAAVLTAKSPWGKISKDGRRWRGTICQDFQAQPAKIPVSYVALYRRRRQMPPALRKPKWEILFDRHILLYTNARPRSCDITVCQQTSTGRNSGKKIHKHTHTQAQSQVKLMRNRK